MKHITMPLTLLLISLVFILLTPLAIIFPQSVGEGLLDGIEKHFRK